MIPCEVLYTYRCFWCKAIVEQRWQIGANMEPDQWLRPVCPPGWNFLASAYDAQLACPKHTLTVTVKTEESGA